MIKYNEKFCITTRPHFLYKAEVLAIGAATYSPCWYLRRVSDKVYYTKVRTGDTFIAESELAFWNYVKDELGSMMQNYFRDSSLVEGALAVRGEILIDEGELALNARIDSLKSEMTLICKTFLDSIGLSLVRESIGIVQRKTSQNIPIWSVKASVYGLHLIGKTKICMKMMPDPIETNGWKIKVSIPRTTLECYQKNQEIVQLGLARAAEILNINIIDVDYSLYS